MKIALRILLALWALLIFPGAGHTTPFFARTYNLACTTCHAGVPRLNEFGLEFKANGFRMLGAEKSAKMAWQTTVPLAVQVEPTDERFSPGHLEVPFTDTALLAGGLITNRTSFYVHDSLWDDSNPNAFPTYEAWVQQIIDERTKTMVKVGQFELPYGYSPLINRADVTQPLVFGAGIQGNDVRLGAAMRGLQFSGIISQRVRWYLGLGEPSVQSTGNTVGEREFLGQYRDVFLRFAGADFTRNVGGFVYLSHPPRDPSEGSTRNDGERFGIEGTRIWRGFEFDGMAVYGENSDPLGNGHLGVLRSAFVEVDKMIRPWVAINARWDAQTISTTINNYTDAQTIGIRFYPLKGQRLLRLQAEYQQADHGRSSTALEAAVTF